MAARPRLKQRIPLLLVIAIVLVAVADSSRQIDAQAALTVALAGVLAAATIPSLLRAAPGRVMPPISLFLFLLLALWSYVRRDFDTFHGSQNMVLYGIFVLAIPVAAARATPQIAIRVLRGYSYAGVAVAVVYLWAVVQHGPNTDLGLFAPRPAAGAMLPAVAASVALVAMTSASRWPLLIIWVGIASTLSRAAMATALILTLGLAFDGKRPARTLVRLLLLAAAGAATAWYAYNNYEPLRRRFEEGDGYQLGNFTLGTSGRSVLWDLAWEHWKQAPWTGHGIGSSEEWINLFLPTQTHPHNDYLRVLHDFGIFGLVLFVVGVLTLTFGCFSRYVKSTDPVHKAVHLAATLCMAYLLSDMFFNNPVTAVFVMYPLAVLVGLSRGLGVGGVWGGEGEATLGDRTGDDGREAVNHREPTGATLSERTQDPAAEAPSTVRATL